ncbi:LOW QUALITY PROTEIN: T-cell-interacting, activating receptor on myeloid cells protein 1-like [Peromyscus leucopus]|uniref:LOW QUALITY PROTEIN: T-cell-interacting, activating receptor on myeloid cells protein 1-like n=1 Tax=Peromyscus leucopus TaxID=10041 RepID=UPI0018851A6F|nr:LOW QUALITY PROTEIN: T-cell-interacting, activating receptor on myeloid cells protein 1-like [Peromyscus leucopus]
MIPRLLSLLCLRLCVGQSDIPVNGPPPKPSLSAWPSSVLPTKSSVTMRCRSPAPSEYFIFKKEGIVLDSGKPRDLTEKMTEFHIAELQQNHGGHYTCESFSKWPNGTGTQPSDALLLLVTGYLSKPSLQAYHRGTVPAGSQVILQCQKAGSVLGPMRFALLKEGCSAPVQIRSSTGRVLDFSLLNVTARDSGRYSCVYYQAKAPYRASIPSNPLEVSVTEPPDTMREGYTVGNLIRFGVAAVTVLIMGGFLLEAWHSQRLSPNRPWPHNALGA